MNVTHNTNGNPAAAADKNKHHTESHIYRSQEEFDNELLGRGAGDPDAHGYPGQPDEEPSNVTEPTDQPF